jgi:quercetin dioxygenase-like cupin family protein
VALPLLELAAAVAAADVRTEGVAVAVTAVAAGAMPPLHVHACDEVLHVLEGELTLHVAAGADGRLAAGEARSLPAGVAHTHRAGAAGARYLSASPARSLAAYETFVRAVAAPGPLGECEAGLVALAEANGIVVLGPPGTLPG